MIYMDSTARRPKTKILVDGGDPQETAQIRKLIGYVDGQTTNPTLIAKNPEVRKLISSGQKLSSQQEMDEYKKIVQAISPLVRAAGVSIERAEAFELTTDDRHHEWQSELACTNEGLGSGADSEELKNPSRF